MTGARELDWSVVAVYVALVVVAGLVNWRAPAQRARIKRAVFLCGAFGIAVLVREGVASRGDAWYGRVDSVVDVLAACAFVNVGGLALFFVALPAVGAAPPSIVRDLVALIAYAVAAVVVLSRHGMNPTSAVATAGVASAVLAISLQQTLGNILGGMALQLDGSIQEGDWLQFPDGKQGKVMAVRWRHTLLETRDWSTIVVPNSQLLANNITILGKRGGKFVPTRNWIYFNVDHRYPPQRVCRAVNEALAASPMENVADEPRANAVCMDLAKDSYAYYGVRYWTIDMGSNDGTSSLVRTRTFNALRRAGIPLAVPRDDEPPGGAEPAPPRRAAPPRRRRELRGGEVGEPVRVAHRRRAARPRRGHERRALREGRDHHAPGRDGALALPADERPRRGPHACRPRRRGSRARSRAGGRDARGARVLRRDGAHDESRAAPTSSPPARSSACGSARRRSSEILRERPDIAGEVSTILAKRGTALATVREGLTEEARRARESSERERILTGIKAFFGL